MRRRLFAITAALSLLLLFATAVLWVWSYHTTKSVLLTTENDNYFLENVKGRCEVIVFNYSPGVGEDADLRVPIPDSFGFIFDQVRSAGARRHVIAVPCWSIASLAALLPCLWLIRFRRKSSFGIATK